MKYWILGAWIVLAGCGYQPSSHLAKNVVGDSVSTEVIVRMEDPQNTVIIKDAVDSAVITKFRTGLASKSEAVTHLKIAINSVTFSPLRYDTNGYVITYRARVMLSINRTRENRSMYYQTKGTYDFDIEPNAIISDQVRFEAIRQGAQKALDAFVAQVAAQGANLTEWMQAAERYDDQNLTQNSDDGLNLK